MISMKTCYHVSASWRVSCTIPWDVFNTPECCDSDSGRINHRLIEMIWWFPGSFNIRKPPSDIYWFQIRPRAKEERCSAPNFISCQHILIILTGKISTAEVLFGWFSLRLFRTCYYHNLCHISFLLDSELFYHSPVLSSRICLIHSTITNSFYSPE